jgi:hypothetical protein
MRFRAGRYRGRRRGRYRSVRTPDYQLPVQLPGFEDSVLPILDAGRMEFVDDGYELGTGLTLHRCRVTRPAKWGFGSRARCRRSLRRRHPQPVAGARPYLVDRRVLRSRGSSAGSPGAVRECRRRRLAACAPPRHAVHARDANGGRFHAVLSRSQPLNGTARETVLSAEKKIVVRTSVA